MSLPRIFVTTGRKLDFQGDRMREGFIGVESGDAGVVGGDGVRGEAAAVEEDEGVAGADAAEVDVGVVAAGIGAAVLGFVEREIGHLRKGGEHLDRREGVARLDLVEVEDGDGENFS